MIKILFNPQVIIHSNMMCLKVNVVPSHIYSVFIVKSMISRAIMVKFVCYHNLFT